MDFPDATRVDGAYISGHQEFSILGPGAMQALMTSDAFQGAYDGRIMFLGHVDCKNCPDLTCACHGYGGACPSCQALLRVNTTSVRSNFDSSSRGRCLGSPCLDKEACLPCISKANRSETCSMLSLFKKPSRPFFRIRWLE